LDGKVSILKANQKSISLILAGCVFLLAMCPYVHADYGYSDSQSFSLDLLTNYGTPNYGSANSENFNLNLLNIRRTWADSGEFTYDVDGTISIERPGAAVSFWGAHRNSAASSDPNGILLGSCSLISDPISDPCYCFILPPTLPNHVISSMTIEIKGTGKITALYIGDFQIAQTGTDDWSCTWTDTLYSHLEDMSEYFDPIFANNNYPIASDPINGKVLWVKLYVDGGTWPSWCKDQYDLKKIVVTYTYTNTSNVVLRDFQTMYQAAHDLHLFKSRIYNFLWDPTTLALTYIGDTWLSAITNLCSVDPISVGLSGAPLLKSLWDAYKLPSNIDDITTTMNNLERNFNAYTFWEGGSPPAYHTNPNRHEVGTMLETATANLYAYSQDLLSVMDSPIPDFAQTAIDTKNSLNGLKAGLTEAFVHTGGLYDVNFGLSGNGGDHREYANLIIKTLSPWVVFDYNEANRPQQPSKSYLEDIVCNINRQFSGSLIVNISPQEAVNAGAQWSIDGGVTWHNSGNVAINLFESNHIVTYKPITGWITPPNQTVTLNANTLNYVYITMQAYPVGDFTQDNKVDFLDLDILIDQWIHAPGNTSADIAPQPNGDGIVNFFDFALFAQNWLEGI
jgi:hypothetical protein